MKILRMEQFRLVQINRHARPPRRQPTFLRVWQTRGSVWSSSFFPCCHLAVRRERVRRDLPRAASRRLTESFARLSAPALREAPFDSHTNPTHMAYQVDFGTLNITNAPPLPKQGRKFRVAVLGDFSARASRGEGRSQRGGGGPQTVESRDRQSRRPACPACAQAATRPARQRHGGTRIRRDAGFPPRCALRKAGHLSPSFPACGSG